MKEERSAYIKSTVFCAALLLLSLLAAVFPTKSETEIYDDVIRLHVIAASDSQFDTAVKILVKDAVLSEIEDIYREREVEGDTALDRCRSAKTVLSESLGRIVAAAEQRADELNAGDVSVSLSTDRFPEKTYGDVTLPAGYYESLTVRIGEAEGHNWWCVVYPVICLSPSSPAVVMRQTGFTNDQIDVLQGGGGYVIKIKLLELFSSIFGK
ncbi:MAG: stage II sporulation protein R [Clostridia bacterium]|nr:stage II sporulation protein R [Clostridia bacterium]